MVRQMPAVPAAAAASPLPPLPRRRFRALFFFLRLAAAASSTLPPSAAVAGGGAEEGATSCTTCCFIATEAATAPLLLLCSPPSFGCFLFRLLRRLGLLPLLLRLETEALSSASVAPELEAVDAAQLSTGSTGLADASLPIATAGALAIMGTIVVGATFSSFCFCCCSSSCCCCCSAPFSFTAFFVDAGFGAKNLSIFSWVTRFSGFAGLQSTTTDADFVAVGAVVGGADAADGEGLEAGGRALVPKTKDLAMSNTKSAAVSAAKRRSSAASVNVPWKVTGAQREEGADIALAISKGGGIESTASKL